MANRIVVLAGFAILIFVGLGAVNAQWQDSVTDSQDAIEVENESWTVDAGSITQLDNSDRDVVYNDSVTVRDENDTVVAADGNYSWLAGNGTVKALSGSSELSDGESATITYRYTEPSNAQNLAKSVGMLPVTLGDEIALALAAGVLLGAVALLRRG